MLLVTASYKIDYSKKNDDSQSKNVKSLQKYRLYIKYFEMNLKLQV